jgi:hypothetical protein
MAPVAAKPAATKRTAAKPAAAKPAASRSAASKRSAAAKPAAGKSAGAKPAAGRSAASKTSAAKPAASKSTSAKRTGGKSATGRATASKPATKSATAKGASKGGAASTNRPRVKIDGAQVEAVAERLRKLNERIIDFGREAGESTLASYEKALKTIANGVQQSSAKDELEWISHLAASQAKFVREITDSWAKAARDRLK